jgi:transposase
MAKSLTVRGFVRMFPDDDACLNYLWKVRFGSQFRCPNCGKIQTPYRLSKRLAYSCQCGGHLYPKVGTAFFRTHIPLQKWFFAIFLFTSTPHGVSANELQRQLGVRIKTASRMAHIIRRYLDVADSGGRHPATAAEAGGARNG